MIIDGQKISRSHNKEKASDYYYNTIKKEVRQAINELPFAQIIKVTKSATSTSLYFKIRLKHFEEPITLSVRSHIPTRSARSILSFYVNKYKTMKDLRFDIQLKLTKKYNVKADFLLLKTFELPSRGEKKVSQAKRVLDSKSRNDLLEKAYRYEVLPSGWANLIDVSQTLGSTFNASGEELGVKKLRNAYINSDLYDIKEVEKDGKKEK